MIRQTLSFAVLLFAVLLMPPLAVVPAAAKEPVYTGFFGSLAVSGYDPVAYFVEGRPVEGRKDFEIEWNGATWRFANMDNLAAFKAEPEKFAPQYGGYCAWAVSQGGTASTDPEVWGITDGKLYLNYSESVQSQWIQDIPGNIAKAEKNWPGVLE
jgi:YHS domain-containing protein